ncbi:C-C motif chemokine 36.1 [Nematolebias whitei]|uniref:C-C motif chemokine 36.1 n=1 Tax=Nematolebias whitei TaxID=451745 RepID=UPI001896C23E|nr:C-C motif chemokine 36.1 [Nematolebias whitei]
MRTTHILLLCIVGAALISAAVCSDLKAPDVCCFDLYDWKINKKFIKFISSYFMTDPRCAKTAAVLVTVKGRRICVDPNRPWVKNVISKLEASSF